jgi:transcriptional regulator with XRE-family HTH domain
MMQERTHKNFRPGTSRRTGTATTFRDQMSDFAKGERLRELREARHMSREDAAHEIGVSARALYVWETKDGPIKWANAVRAAEVYDVEPETLVSRQKLGGYGEQLDRIESLLEAIAAELGVDAAAALRRRLSAAAEQHAERPADTPATSRDPGRRAQGS